MYLAYSFLLTLGLIVLIPRLFSQALAHGKYVSSIRQRLGALPRLTESALPTIWLHCVSVGETQAARPLVAELRRSFPEHRLIVSTITLTGQKLAREVFKDEAHHVVYFPFDWYWCVRRALNVVKPDVVLIMETELWPNFLRCCRRREIPVILVNGRISKQSFRGYRLVRFFISRIIASLTLAAMQSKGDAARLRFLGMPPNKLFVTGNLKFDSRPPTASDVTDQIRTRFNLRPEVPLILAASTHSEEERIIIESFKKLRENRSTPIRLMIAPRHPERFAEVASLLSSSGLTWARRSQPGSNDDGAEVVLLDTIGELPATYPLATIVFVGGSLVEKGGHNVLEPATVGNAIVTGAHTDNFEAVVDLLDQNNAIIQLPRLEGEELVSRLQEVFEELLTSAELRKEMGQRAQELVISNRGAAEKTLALIAPLLNTYRTQGSRAIPEPERRN
jgi:3-deoxy-D-manno-octulosonic-acid transferase